MLRKCHNLQFLSLKIITLPTDATIYEDGTAHIQQMKQSTAQDATRRVCNDTAMDDKEGTMRSLQQINTCSTDQRINRSTDQQINGSTDFWINGSKDQRIKNDNQNR